MAYAVLPALFISLVVGEFFANELIDLAEREAFHGRAFDRHADERHIGIRRLFEIGLAVGRCRVHGATRWRLV